ncbi:MBL fold metallo-hydrolase [Microlunatus elymi]|uniref:MBL fold metallo-hydrolase n=1 Tax=Microlunatus elymi TaxID=2596828 RepID=A0A516PY68_9ACTN|nr:ComEC/Rec2 family competence protein [Microlunatus elymi]QDP96118.1 MBL fold metallo-hydrolase [Microlunatus elymi]
MTDERPDLRLLPIALAAWGGSWLGTSGRTMLIMIGAAAAMAVLLGLILRRSWLIAATALTLAGLLLIGWLHQAALTGTAASRLARSRAIVTADLVIKNDPVVQPSDGIRPPYLSLRASENRLAGRGRQWRERAPVLVTASGEAVARWQRVPVGSMVRVTARLDTARPGSDFAAVARAAGAPLIMEQPGLGARSVEHVRAGLRRAVARGSPEQRALVPSLVLGDTAGITPQIRADFLSTGLTHLTAVSGANLAILIAFLMIIARWIGVRGWWLRMIGLAGVAVFVLLCRTEPSVLRAAAMGLVALAALGMSGRSRGLRSLCVAMVILLIMDPWLGRSLGFALSVLATGGIIWWSGRWVVAMRPWLPKIVAESIAVPLAAHLATLPVAAAISGQVSMVGILTNAVAGPFVGPATVLGFAAAGLSVLSSTLAGWVGWASCWAAQPILWTAHYGSALPGASWSWPVTPVALTLLATACLLIGVAMGQLLGSRWIAAVLALLMIMAVLRAPAQPGWPPKDWLAVACDVGQGDGLVVRIAERSAIVIDTGPDPKPMRSCLDQLGIRRVSLMILSHFHADHVGGLEGALAGRRVDRIWVSPYASPTHEAEVVRQRAATLGIPVTVPDLGTRRSVGAAELSVLGPLDRQPSPVISADGQSALENDLSLVIMISIDRVRILFTGDVEPEEQRRVLASGADLRADVLKVPHHGSSRQDPDFIAATHAQVGIASAGQDNSYGHPAPRTMQLLRSDGMTALCTCIRGSIALTADRSGRLRLVGQRSP